MSLRNLLAARQRDEIRESQRDYLTDRLTNLENIHKPELNAELALIAGIAQLGASRSSFLDGQSKERALAPQHILEELYRVVKERLPRQVLNIVNDECFDPGWVKKDYYPGLSDVSLLDRAFRSIC